MGWPPYPAQPRGLDGGSRLRRSFPVPVPTGLELELNWQQRIHVVAPLPSPTVRVGLGRGATPNGVAFSEKQEELEKTAFSGRKKKFNY